MVLEGDSVMFLFTERKLQTVMIHLIFLQFLSRIISGYDCSCSAENDVNMCNTLGLDQARDGHAKYWCYVESDTPCVDKQESSTEQGRFYSFQACASKH